MVNDSPNNSILTFSPLMTTKKVRDHFQTPNQKNNKTTTVQQNQNTQRLNSAQKSQFFPLPNSYLHQSSPQNARLINSIMEDPNDETNNNTAEEVKNVMNSTTQVNEDPDKSGPYTNNINNLETSTIVDMNQPLTQADKLRLWRHDALLQHHYKTAVYIGDKILSLTGDPNDAFWLAQVHYSSGNYQVARNLLLGPKFEDSIGCRYLAGLCLYKLDKLDEALDIIGEINPFKKDHSIRNGDGGIKLEASMCYLRGLVYNKQNNFERAKECFKEAVLVDVKCFEAFDELISNHLLSPDEEWELLECLNFDDADNNNELVKMLYTTRINKYKNLKMFEESKQRLIEEFNLGDNIDVLLSQAELYFIQCKFQKCLELCSTILERDELNIPALSKYLSCLYEVGGKNKLFLTAHKLAEDYPNHYITWVAIGIYYFSIKQTADARMFFSKASIINPNFAAAWIGFAHTFAADGEHEQAISAYATASRLFPGTHLPNLFLGMQYLQMNNYTLAWEYLNFAYSVCSSDPLLLNEIGVLNYHKDELQRAEFYLRKALGASRSLEYGSKSWCSIHCNLAHVYRRMNKLEKSVMHFNEVLKISKDDVNIFSTLGLIYLKMGKIANAIEYLHIALSIQPTDSIATDLLDKALDLNLKLANKKMLDKSLSEGTNKANSNLQQQKNFSGILGEFSGGNKRNRKGLGRYQNEVDDDDEIMDIESE